MRVSFPKRHHKKQRPYLLGGLSHEDESLGVRDELGCVEGLLEIVDEHLLVTRELLLLGTRDGLAGADTLVLDGRQASCEDSLTDQGDGGTSVQGSDCGPLAGSLLASGIEDLGDEGLAVNGVVVSEDVVGDFDEEGVKDTGVPLLEDVGDLTLGEIETALEDIVGFGNKLHVSVLDTFIFQI